MPYTSGGADQSDPTAIAAPLPPIYDTSPGGESAIPGFLNSGALDTGNPVTSALDTFLAGGGGSVSPGALVLAGGAALALAIVLMPTPSGSRRR